MHIGCFGVLIPLFIQNYCVFALENSTSKWMSRLHSYISIADLSIPGTHNSATWLSSLDFDRCQTWSLVEQLNNGIRFLDIRGRHYENSLFIHHDLIYEGFNMTNVLVACVEFLKDNPTEIILMRIREEYTTEDNTNTYKQSLQDYLQSYPDSFFWKQSDIPSVGEARGKIVIFHEWSGPTIGINYAFIDIEDNWDVPNLLPGSINSKWISISRHLKKAAEQTFPPWLFITWTSGASAFAYPNAVANQINPMLDKFLIDNSGKKKWGIIAMDFPTQAIIDKIIATNFR